MADLQSLMGVPQSQLQSLAQPAGIDEQAYQRYPRLRSYGFQFIPPTDGGKSDGRYLETYPADEEWNPKPGKPTIQQFDKNATADDFMGETLHILPKIDPTVGAIRDSFIKSMTPRQQQRLIEQYDYAKQNHGEDRSFEDWRDMSGRDAWFRGAVTGQWPKELYEPNQLQMFDSLKSYLQGDH